MTTIIADATDHLTSATTAAAKALDRGMSYDSIIFAGVIIIPSVFVLLVIILWRFCLRDLLDAAGKIIADVTACAREIAEIHERVINRSPVEYREVIMARAKNQDHGPSPRIRRENNLAEG